MLPCCCLHVFTTFTLVSSWSVCRSVGLRYDRATDGTVCKMQIWDTAGQERFRAMAPLYYRNAAVAVVCFDIMDEESFQKMKDWVEELRTNVPEGKLVLAIACTKVWMDTWILQLIFSLRLFLFFSFFLKHQLFFGASFFARVFRVKTLKL